MNKKNIKRIQLLSRLPVMRYAYARPKSKAPLPVNLTISLLYSCNSRCQTCNVYEKKAADFTVEEYEKTFASIGKAPYWFTMSGGEPFLRKDIVDVCLAAAKYCEPGIINIPTNGSLYKVIPERVQALLEQLP
ncbi:MAG TPA: radical SAM protein, partial [Calditrichaeota bacterium]|nr:radical SAM protein [Calditrichota bacterium]